MQMKQFFDWRFGKIGYSVKGRGEPLLLVHGLGYGRGSDDFTALLPALTKKYRVYAVDLLGYGCSDTPALTYSAYLYAALIRDFTKEIINDKTTVVAVGQSAALTAKACAMDPALFTRLVFINPKKASLTYHPIKNRLLEWRVSKKISRLLLGGGLSFPRMRIKNDLRKIKVPQTVFRGKAGKALLRYLRAD
jgi:pimeloyl-ACP methyl ester carboxylesterase